MHISFGKSARDTVPVGKEMSFEQFVKVLSELPIHVGRLHWSEYVLAGKQERSRDKDTRWIIPAVFIRPERRAEAVGALTGFVCDFDDGCITRDQIEAFGRKNRCRYVAYTSYSNGLDGKEKWRVFVPYASPIAPHEHQAVFEWFNRQFDGHLDPRCATISQLWYLRGRPTGAPPGAFFSVTTGSDFDARQCQGSGNGTSVPPASGNFGHDVLGGSGGGVLSTLASRAAQDNDDLISRGPTSTTDIKNALAALDPNLYEDYTEWLNIGMAIYDGTAGSSEGLDLFDAWSATVPSYGGRADVAQKWYSFGGRKGLRRITVASLFKHARDAGWDPGHTHSDQCPPVRFDPNPAPDNLPAAGVQASAPALSAAVLHVPPVIVTAPVLPPTRWRAHPGAFATQKQIEDPDTGNTRWVTCVNNFKVLRLDLLRTIDGGDHTAEIEAENANGPIIATFNAGLLASPTEFKSFLLERGMFVTVNEFKDLQEMLVEWLKKIQDNIRVKQSFTHMGWMEKDTSHLGFAHGNTAYYADGSKETNIKVSEKGGASIAKHYMPQGDLNVWKGTTRFLSSQNRPELMAILSTAFGSPLMRFSGHSGAVVSIVSTASGVGKSTALSLAQSVWGNPKAAMHSAADTVLSLSSKMGFTKDLPAYWDDIKGEKTFEQFASTIYQITQGKEKARLDQQANLREVQNWNCLAVVAANDSLIEIVKRYGKGTDAGTARIFEIRLEQRPAMTQQATFFDQVTTNYGRAGEVYAAWLAANLGTARRLVEGISERLYKELEVESEERFWVASIAVMLAGAQIAKMLGLVDFDVPGLSKYLKQRFVQLRGGKTEQMKELSPGPMVADMILDHQITTLRIEAMPFKNRAKTNITRPPKNGEVDIMIADQDAVLRVRKAKFIEWCKARGHSHTTLYEKLAQAGAIKEKNVDPMAGTSPYSSNSRTTCYDIDLKVLGLQIGDEDGL